MDLHISKGVRVLGCLGWGVSTLSFFPPTVNCLSMICNIAFASFYQSLQSLHNAIKASFLLGVGLFHHPKPTDRGTYNLNCHTDNMAYILALYTIKTLSKLKSM